MFISWSGARSKFVAEVLRSWLPKVIQSVKPWMSEEDISAGSRWSNDVSKELSHSNFGIICVTPENQANPWLLFEAGALSKTLDESYVCPLLFDMSPGQLAGPLSQFQASQIDQVGALKLLVTMNKALGTSQLNAEDLEEIFKVWWPRLDQRLKDAPAGSGDKQVKRGVEDLLEEVVENTREQLRRENLRMEHSKEKDARLDSLLDMMDSSMAAMKNAQKIPQMIARFIGAREPSSPEELAISQLVRSLPSMDMEGMANVVAQMQELKVREQRFTDELLNKPAEGNGAVASNG
ncbi:TIR domain-containing protein [Massilia sp. W12]|uniref:toll/interleukin-1 receptor domain-containing protein n=1 Tax=Massilia sp. W12 TaxID=3126507 RepID=UPI0030D3B9F5